MLWLVVLFAAAQAAPDCKNCAMLGKEEKAMFRAHSDACLAQSGAEPLRVDGLLRGEPLDEPALRRHVYCVLRRCKLVGKDGKLQKARFGKMPRNATEVLQRCAAAGDAPEDLAWSLFRCGARRALLHRMPTPSGGPDDDAD